MKLDAIHHVAVIVSDYERAKEFYVGKLGFQVLRENYQARRGSYKLDLKMCIRDRPYGYPDYGHSNRCR